MFVYEKKLVLEGKEFFRVLPVNISSDHADHFNANLKYKCPDLFLYIFKNIRFLPDSTLFTFRVWPLSISFPFYKKRIRHHSIKGIIDIQLSWAHQLFKRVEGPYLIIHDQWTLNYYHWITQALPRLLMVLKANVPFTLLLPKTYNKEFHLKSLRILGVEYWVSFEVEKTYYNVPNLLYPSHDIQVGDYHDGLMRELSMVLRKPIAPNVQKKHLFVHRASKNERIIINEEEVLAAFMKWGFIVIDFEKLNFDEQRIIASEASILAGVHGAGLTNMLFMKRGAKVFELTSFLNGEQYYYYTLSNALGHHYYYQKCSPEEGGKTIQEANFYVSISDLDRNLQLMIRDNND